MTRCVTAPSKSGKSRPARRSCVQQGAGVERTDFRRLARVGSSRLRSSFLHTHARRRQGPGRLHPCGRNACPQAASTAPRESLRMPEAPLRGRTSVDYPPGGLAAFERKEYLRGRRVS